MVGYCAIRHRNAPFARRQRQRPLRVLYWTPGGPLLGVSGVLLFMIAMLYVPMAQARHAISGEWRSFYDFRTVRTIARERPFVNEAQTRITQNVVMPPGYLVEWGGQFQNLERARVRLAIIVPTALLLVFFLLYFSLGSLRDVLIIYSGVPFAAVGFIALAGIAVLNGQVLLGAIRDFREDTGALIEAVMRGGQQWLRPVLATAITDAAGFIPMAISTGVGAEVQRPLATVVVGGVLTNTLLTLFVLPILYALAHRATRANPTDPLP